MRPDNPHIDWTHRTEPDDLPEWMDEPCTPGDLRACLADLERVNALTLGYRPTLGFLDSLTRASTLPNPLRILDVGFGGGALLARIEAWARRRRLPVELTGIDLNPTAATLAQAQYGSLPIRWLTGDALAYTEPVDVVLSSLLTHHLPTAQVIHFLRWMESTAAVGWFVNDLQRSPRSASGFRVLAGLMRWHRFVRHDGPVSFARSFLSEDWQRMLAQAGLAPGAANVMQHFPLEAVCSQNQIKQGFWCLAVVLPVRPQLSSLRVPGSP